MKVAFHTLGCKVNQNDTQGLIKLFQDNGYEIVPFAVGADIYVINTCVVTGVGERKSRQVIRKAIDYKSGAIVVVTGCYAQTSPQAVAGIPGVNLVLGMADRPRIVDLVRQFQKEYRQVVQVKAINATADWVDLPVSEQTERTRATLKIEEGCDQFCSYCIVPYARGSVKSMPVQKIMADFSFLLEQGYREIVLTGIHLGAFGQDIDCGLNSLIQKLLEIPGNFRIRLGSLEPNDLSEELVETIANHPKVCQYLHIPLQSGSDFILKRMNRGYNLNFYRSLLSKIRSLNPLIAIGTDLIVGFPGETEADFVSTSQFVTEQEFSRMHIFRFSPRPGTPAAEFSDQVAKVIQEKRSQQMQEIAHKASFKFMQKFRDEKVEVLFEEKNDAGWTGLSGEYLRVKCHTDLDLKNSLQKVSITKVEQEFLIGVC